MSPRFDIAVCAAALICGGCSKVVGELDLHCDKQSDCDALNAAAGLDLEKHCFVYQCRSDGRGCEKREQDLDEDGAPAEVCDGKVEAKIDCDDNPDGGGSRTPGAQERCDGVDNNCDEIIDEGRTLSVVQERQETLPGTITDLSATELPDGRALAVASVQRATPIASDPLLHEIWAVIVDPEHPERQLAPKLVTADGFAGKNCGPNAKCAFSGATAFADRNGLLFTAATEMAGCSGAARVLFGLETSAVAEEAPARWSWSQASSAFGPLAIEPDAAACEPGARVVLTGPRYTTNDLSILAAWWNPDNAQLALARLTTDRSTRPTLRVADMPRSAPALPAASVDHAPALVAIAGKTPSYLVAYATEQHDACSGIVVARVVADSSGSPVPEQIACLGAAGAMAPVLATASVQDDLTAGDRAALAWPDGHGALLFSSLRMDEGGEALATGKPRSIPATEPGALSMAWFPSADSGRVTGGRWLLTWTDTCGPTRCLYGALLDADDAAPEASRFQLANLAETSRPLTLIQPSRQTLALIRAESTSLHIGFLDCQ